MQLSVISSLTEKEKKKILPAIVSLLLWAGFFPFEGEQKKSEVCLAGEALEGVVTVIYIYSLSRHLGAVIQVAPVEALWSTHTFFRNSEYQ